MGIFLFVRQMQRKKDAGDSLLSPSCIRSTFRLRAWHLLVQYHIYQCGHIFLCDAILTINIGSNVVIFHIAIT